jgi:AcrR family transcriptional regulator
MNGHEVARARPRGGLADKRQAILGGALAVFSRDGYTRASIDAISAEAGVSTRTIYNHFEDKGHLFQTVIQESTALVADAQIAIIASYLRKVTDLEEDLIEFGRALATPMSDYAEHFALVRQINAEVGHIPQEAIDAWQEAGPRRVLGELALRMRRLGEQGLLSVDDPDRAAVHFMLLVQGAVPFHHGIGATSEEEIEEIVTSGVRTFLHGFLP